MIKEITEDEIRITGCEEKEGLLKVSCKVEAWVVDYHGEEYITFCRPVTCRVKSYKEVDCTLIFELLSYSLMDINVSNEIKNIPEPDCMKAEPISNNPDNAIFQILTIGDIHEAITRYKEDKEE